MRSKLSIPIDGLFREEATEEKAKSLSPHNDVIHFASHAELSEVDPLASAILLAKNEKEDGRLEVREIFAMNLKAHLIVLSACETGLGKLSSGDELIGLTRAFIYAGTPSVVASLWNVEDNSTAALMVNFYKNLKTMTKIEALRRAQLQLIRGESKKAIFLLLALSQPHIPTSGLRLSWLGRENETTLVFL